MHKLKELRDELIDEAESYVGAIKDGHDEKDAMCVKCLASAADHLDAILERHGMLEDEDEGKRSGRRMSRGRSYGMGDGYDDMSDRVERGRADATSGNDRRTMRDLKRALMEASRMAENM